MKKPAREDTKVLKGHVALFFKNTMVSGKCTFIGKKYKDGQAIIEITLLKNL